MVLVVKDRIKDTSTTTGTGTITLANSPPNGFQAFSTLGNNSTTYYAIQDANDAFEIGLGTYNANTLTRTTVLASSNSGNLVSLTSPSSVWVDYPASKAYLSDEGIDKSFTATASITAGKPVILNSAGTVTQVVETTTFNTSPTISTVTKQNGTGYSYYSNSIAYEATSGYYVRGRKDTTNDYPCVESGTWGSLTAGITWNTPTILYSNLVAGQEVKVATGGGYAHLAYCTRENSNQNAKVTPIAISGSGGLSLGTTTTVSITATSSSDVRPYGIEYDTSQDTILAFFYLGWASGYLNKVFPLQMSGSNYSYSSSDAVTLTSGIDVYMKSLNTVFDPDTNRTIAFYNVDGVSVNGIVLSCSGTSITKGATQSPSLTAPVSNGWTSVAYDTQNNKIIFMYAISSYKPKYSIVTVTGGGTNTLSFTSDAYAFANTSQQAEACAITWNGDANRLFMVYPKYADSHVQCNTFTSNGSTLTTITQEEISTEEMKNSGGTEEDATVFVTGKGVSYSLGDSDTSPGILNFTLSVGSITSTNLTSSSYLGVASTSASASASVNINIPRSINNNQTSLTVGEYYYTSGNGVISTTFSPNFIGRAISSTQLLLEEEAGNSIVGFSNGAITKGKPVVIQADGDVAQVASTSTTTSFSQTIGAETTLNTSGRDYYSTAHNNNGTFIIVYRPDSPDKVNARLGTYASNGTITWGTNIVLTKPSVATIQSVSCYYDPDNDCFVALGGTGTNQYVYATILTYSGVTLTEGNYVEFDPNGSNTNGTSHISAQYDTVNNIGYAACSRNGDSVTTLTVSGTTITAGSRQYVFGSYTSTMQYLSLNYDSANNRGTMYYRDVSNSYYASAVAFTSSGGTLTFGTKVVLDSSGSGNRGDCANSPTQTYIAYKNGDYIYYNNLTFSGASITAGSKQTLTNVGSLDIGTGTLFLYNPDGKFYFVFTRTGTPKWLALAQGTVSGTTLNNTNIEIYNNLSSDYEDWIVGNTSISNPTMILAGKDLSNNYAEALTFVPTATVTVTTFNLTATNYIGIASDTVADNKNVLIDTQGAANPDQSSLTPAQLYYVQTNGTLSTTAGSPSVVAGIATSATTLLITRS